MQADEGTVQCQSDLNIMTAPVVPAAGRSCPAPGLKLWGGGGGAGAGKQLW